MVSVLVVVVQKVGFDLIFCGDGFFDFYVQQVGLLVGEIFNILVVNGVSKIIFLMVDIFIVECELEDEIEILSILLFVVVVVFIDINFL